jgi:hypothetical protein
MFSDNPNIIKYADEVYLYKNFIPKEDIEYINNLMEPHREKENSFSTDVNTVDWYNDKEGPQMPELIRIWDRVSEFLAPEFVIHPQQNLAVMKPGDKGMFVHNDNPGEGMDDLLTQEDRWHTCCVLSYGVCIYFGEFEGGELFYPHIQSDGKIATEEHIDDYLVVPVQPGDLAIHWAQAPYEHGTKEVASGIRYVYSNFALKAEKNPGTFPAWGTQEDLDRKANGTWMKVICDKHNH